MQWICFSFLRNIILCFNTFKNHIYKYQILNQEPGFQNIPLSNLVFQQHKIIHFFQQDCQKLRHFLEIVFNEGGFFI